MEPGSEVEHPAQELSRARRAANLQPNRATVWLSGEPEGQKPATPPFGLDDVRDSCQNAVIRVEANPVSARDLDSLEYATDQTTEKVFPTNVERRRVQRGGDWQVFHLVLSDCPRERNWCPGRRILAADCVTNKENEDAR